MGKKLHVGNLPFSIDDEELSNVFSKFGTVESARVIKDKISGRSKGFGFVEMSTDQEAEASINGLNRKDLDGRSITVSEARSSEERAPRPSGGGGRFDYRGGGDRSGGGGDRSGRGNRRF